LLDTVDATRAQEQAILNEIITPTDPITLGYCRRLLYPFL
jgi:hypothetical protein